MNSRFIQYFLFFSLFFISCQNINNKISDSKWKIYDSAPFIYNFSLDQKQNSDYLENHFNNDSITYKSLDSLFNKNGFKYSINDTSIILPFEENVNGQKVCCKYDTSNFLIDTLDSKTILYLYKYGTMFVSEKKLNLEVNKRPQIIIPSWNVELGEFLNEANILDSIKINHYYYINESTTTFTQHLKQNVEVQLKTLKFEGDSKRLVFELNCGMDKFEVDSFIDYFKKKYPNMPIEIKYDEFKKPSYSFNKFGYSFYIYSPSVLVENDKEYNISITDNFKTLKNIYRNKKKKYKLIEYSYKNN